MVEFVDGYLGIQSRSKSATHYTRRVKTSNSSSSKVVSAEDLRRVLKRSAASTSGEPSFVHQANSNGNSNIVNKNDNNSSSSHNNAQVLARQFHEKLEAPSKVRPRQVKQTRSTVSNELVTKLAEHADVNLVQLPPNRRDALPVKSIHDLHPTIRSGLKKIKVSEDELNANLRVTLNVLFFCLTEYRHLIYVPDQSNHSRTRSESSIAHKQREQSRAQTEQQQQKQKQQSQTAPAPVSTRRSFLFFGKKRSANPIADLDEVDSQNYHLTSGKDAKKSYRKLKHTASGSFGTVFTAKGKHSSQRLVIKKLEHASRRQKQKNYSEVEFLLRCKHANVVAIHEVHLTAAMDEMWISMEQLDFTLFDCIEAANRFDEVEIAFVTKQVMAGLAHIHSHGLIHRDIKPENIMLSHDGAVKLIDFGLCANAEEGFLKGLVGSPHHVSPEQIKFNWYGCSTDIYSFGVCLLQMLHGVKFSSRGSNFQSMFLAATQGWPSPFADRMVSTACQEFVLGCIAMNPTERMSAAQSSKHRFLTSDTSDMALQSLKTVFANLEVLSVF